MRTFPQPSTRGWRALRLLACAFLVLGYFAPLGTHADDSGSLRWKPVDGAQVKLDDKVPLTWNVYQPDKKKQSNLVLVLLGRRYILLDDKAKLAYLVLLSDIHKQDEDITSGDLVIASRVIPSIDWTVRDIGPAEEIRMTLEDYGRTLSVQLPHPLNLRLGIY